MTLHETEFGVLSKRRIGIDPTLTADRHSPDYGSAQLFLVGYSNALCLEIFG
jgi:hypothetical protein